MWSRKTLVFTVLVGSLFGQSIFHSYGVGLPRPIAHVSTIGLGNIGLVPTFREGVSLDNPATWSNLKYTYLNGSFRNLNVTEQISNTLNQATGLSSALFVVPIKGKYAFGLSITPVTDQQVFLQEDSTIFQFGPDSVIHQKSARSGGGVSAFSFAFSFPFEQNSEAGIKVDYLFGSARNEFSLRVNDIEYRQFYRMAYSGLTINSYLNTYILRKVNYQARFFTSVATTIRPLEANVYSFQPYEDSNGNYYYDNTDYPRSLSIDSSVVKSVYSPNVVNLGVDVAYQTDYHFILEYQHWADQATNAKDLSIFGDYIKQINRYEMGLVKFPPRRPREWYQKLIYRVGINRSIFRLEQNGRYLNENGLSIGIGFKFGSAGNQIDLAYKFGSRSLATDHKEAIQELAIEISLGDVWFSKRRERK
ncbi:MAG: hypothetical protein ACE5D2_02715 [Fidelibacterota bacterium]